MPCKYGFAFACTKKQGVTIDESKTYTFNEALTRSFEVHDQNGKVIALSSMASANAENNPSRLDYLFYLVNEADNTAAVVRPLQQTIEAYKSADYWKEFFNISGITTAIDGITVNSPTNHERIYDLRGVEQNSVKGHVIKNGIKIINN